MKKVKKLKKKMLLEVTFKETLLKRHFSKMDTNKSVYDAFTFESVIRDIPYSFNYFFDLNLFLCFRLFLPYQRLLAYMFIIAITAETNR